LAREIATNTRKHEKDRFVPRKRFGQHFLEAAWVEKVIRAIDPRPDQHFIEIGPGAGALTRPLAARAASLTAYEIDRDLAAGLRDAAIANVTVVEGDFLEQTVEPPAPSPQPLRVAGNLPYNVASPIMFRLVELYQKGLPLVDATLMLQREVADRLIAQPGGREYGVFSILIQHAASVEMRLKLPPGAFRPPPKVNSALVRLVFHAPSPPARDPQVFAAMVQALFTRRRKTTANALLAYPPSSRLAPTEALSRAGLDGARRPETLAIPELVRLSDAYASVSQ
jgi:16S rRNA (adenine1518-N6/adenine1519-N6)-dimethyltransferase